MQFGWFSETQEREWGYGYYKTPAGKTVKVTMTTSGVDHGTDLADIQYVGEVEGLDTSFFFKPEEERKYASSKLDISSSSAPVAPSVIEEDEPTLIVFCPYRYWGTGLCRCGRCRQSRLTAHNHNVFEYQADEKVEKVDS